MTIVLREVVTGLIVAAIVGGCAECNLCSLGRLKIQEFHKSYNSRDFHNIDALRTPEFKERVPMEQFERDLVHDANLLGNLTSSREKSWRLRTGVASGEDLTLWYGSLYENGGAVEIFVFKVEGSTLRIADYSIEVGSPTKTRGIDSRYPPLSWARSFLTQLI